MSGDGVDAEAVEMEVAGEMDLFGMDGKESERPDEDEDDESPRGAKKCARSACFARSEWI